MLYKLTFNHRGMCLWRCHKPEITACTYQPATILRHVYALKGNALLPHLLTCHLRHWSISSVLDFKNLRSVNILNVPSLPNSALYQQNTISPNSQGRRKNIFLPLHSRPQSSLSTVFVQVCPLVPKWTFWHQSCPN